MNTTKRVIAALLLLAVSSHVSAQYRDGMAQDTLTASLKVADRFRPARADGYVLDPIKTLRVISPLGSGDAVKYIQTLPGVATGGEGGSAYYVRGGNMGSNLMTLDGVPIYGISHLMGMTTVYPPDVIGAMDFHTGGFCSEEGNFTSSHISLVTRDGNFNKATAELEWSPFLAGASFDVPFVKNEVSFIGSLRASPVGLEYKAFRGIINRHQDVFQDFGTSAGDAFGKVTWRLRPHHTLSLLAFGSMDRYRLSLNENASDAMGWSNLIAKMNWDFQDESGWSLHTAASFNKHTGIQEQETVLDGNYNRLLVRSSLDELTLHSMVSWQRRQWSFQSGIKVRGARFNPGSSSLFDGSSRNKAKMSPLSDAISTTLLASVHGQLEYSKPDHMLFRLALRGNTYLYHEREKEGRNTCLLRPDASLLLRFHLTRGFGFEMTGDYLTQYYHTLEGIPMGMSVDMVVPSDDGFLPERAWQGYGGVFGVFGDHSFKTGGFYKQMKNLVYYGEATLFFSSSQSGWRDNIRVGEGTSYGLEFYYEKVGRVLSWRTAYTLSKTDRLFQSLNYGRRFPAKYDRRHIANASLDWTIFQRSGHKLSLNTLFTYQSGSWETLQDGTLPTFLIGRKDPVVLPLSTSLNNYELPAFIRWDAGFNYEITKQRVHYDFGVGVYNVLNRHNPFMLRYNPDTKGWAVVSLFPIMPVLSCRIAFE